MDDKIPNFWQELKRRRVIRVIPVYAAAAFVLLELVDIISDPFGLPVWTLKLVFVLLCIGLVVAVILSWVYDFTPEGVKKTKPAGKQIQQEAEKHKEKKGWKLVSYISFAVILGLLLVNIFAIKGKTVKSDITDKSIAVLPFKCLSEDKSNQYLADGVMDAILLHLSKIEDLRVLARTSVEQYRDASKTVREIGNELNVAFILEASFQKYGDNARLIVQLIRSSDDGHVWANEYDRDWKDIFAVQSEVAQTIAKELNVVISTEKKQIIDKVPTVNLAAYDLYLKANNFRENYFDNREVSDYQTAMNLYKAALTLDTAFARAHSSLALLYYSRYYYEDYFKENFLDSCLILARKALTLDDRLDEAYFVTGQYYRATGKIDDALENYNKAIRINPNFYSAYEERGYTYLRYKKDYISGIQNYNQALNLVRGDEQASLLRELADSYTEIGFTDRAKNCLNKAITLDQDTIRHYRYLGWLEFSSGNFELALSIIKDALAGDTSRAIAMDFYNCLPPTYSEETYQNVLKMIKRYSERGAIPLQYSHRFGFAFWQVGKEKDAREYFEKQIEYGEESIRLTRSIAMTMAAHYDLAGTYAFIGEKEKAYSYLEEWSRMDSYPLWWVTLFKNDPLFNSIRGEERFQGILLEVEAKYMAEHEKVRKWLEENNEIIL
ncbi:MAG: tetratricopeptide repeat protein [Bacteroidales bacterium]|nr:tetratricopeptide repeat protein [Bacteroidales bacterium]